PVLGGTASVAGTRVTFGAVAVCSLAIAAWAAATPAYTPERPQPLSMLAAAVRDRTVLLSIWLVVFPGMLFGTLNVLGPLRLSDLGFGSVAIGAVWLIAGVLETGSNVYIGRVADRRGPLVPVRVGLVGTAISTLLLPWPDNAYVLGALIVVAALAFGAFYTPGMTLLTNAAERRGIDYGYAFALITLAWAPGQVSGSAISGAVAEATSDAVPYLTLGAIALLTLALLWRKARSS